MKLADGCQTPRPTYVCDCGDGLLGRGQGLGEEKGQISEKPHQ